MLNKLIFKLKFPIPTGFLWVTSTCRLVDYKVLEKHSASTCTITLEMKAAGLSKM
jgi:hypothetical protein